MWGIWSHPHCIYEGYPVSKVDTKYDLLQLSHFKWFIQMTKFICVYILNSLQTINKHITWLQPLSHVTWYFKLCLCVCVSVCAKACQISAITVSLVPHAKGRDKWRSCAPFPFLLNTKNPVYHHGHYCYTIEALSCKVVINSWLWLLAIGKVHQLQNTYQHILQFLRGFASSDLLSAERKVQSLQS